MLGARYITVLDAIAFYYQWLVDPRDRWMFTMNMPEGQYTCNVVVMGYRNSNAHVQRQMDNLFRHIANLQFPKTLKDLEYFIGATGFLRHNVPLYSILIAPLKTKLYYYSPYSALPWI